MATHPQLQANKRRVIFDLSAALPTLQHTLNHENCRACEAAEKLIELDPGEMAKVPFADAAPVWLARRRRDPRRKPLCFEAIENNLNALKKFFGRPPLAKINAGMIGEFQKARKANVLFISADILHP